MKKYGSLLFMILAFSPLITSMEATAMTTTAIPELNHKDNDGQTLLHLASNQGDTGAVTFLLDQDGIEVDIQDNQGRTALMLAARGGCKDIVCLLLTKNAQIDVCDTQSKTALHLAQETAMEDPDNKNLQVIIESLRALHQASNQPFTEKEKTFTEKALSILTNPTIMILSAGLITGLTTGSRYFRQPRFAYGDTAYHFFFFNTLTETQREDHATLLIDVPNPLTLLEHTTFMHSLTLNQRIELLNIIRSYFRQKGLSREPLIAQSIGIVSRSYFQKARQTALNTSRDRYKQFETTILAKLALSTLPHMSPLIMEKAQIILLKRYVIEHETTAFGCTLTHKKCAFAGKDKNIILSDIDDGLCSGLIHTRMKDEIVHLIFSPSAMYLIAVSAAGEISLFDVKDQEAVSSWVYSKDGYITNLCFDATDNHIVTGTSLGTVSIWDLATQKDRVLASTNGSIRSICFSAHQDVIVATAQEVSIYHHVLSDEPSPVSLIIKTDEPVRALAMNDTKTDWCIVDKDHLSIYNADDHTCIQTIHLQVPCYIACIDESGTYAACADLTGKIQLWDIRNATCIGSFDQDGKTLESLCFGQTVRDFLMVSRTGKKLIMSLATVQGLTEQPSAESTKPAQDTEEPSIKDKI